MEPIPLSRFASVKLIALDVSQEPVNTTPAILLSVNRYLLILLPEVITNCNADLGTPDLCNNFTTKLAITQVCPAGFAITVFLSN